MFLEFVYTTELIHIHIYKTKIMVKLSNIYKFYLQCIIEGFIKRF